MEKAVLGKDVAQVQKNIQDYLQSFDLKYVAEDAVYKNFTTGQEHRGKAEIGALIHYMYHLAFDAKPEVKNLTVTEDKAIFDGFFKGRHIGEFAGIAPTGKEVNVPISVSYDLKNGLIKEARIYMLQSVLLQQLGAAQAGGTGQKVAYITRDIFHLKFGHFKEVKSLMEDAMKIMPAAKAQRVLTDFTGDAYRLILEQGFDNLDAYEKTLTSELRADEWQKWYEKFKPHVESSHREILKQVL